MKRVCSECGMCIAACPKQALDFNYTSKEMWDVIKREPSKCSNCKICEKCCPFKEFNNREYDVFIFGNKRETEYEKLVGIYINFYIGHASDLSIRKECSSGGLITSILLYLLQKGDIDGAIVTDFDYNFKPHSKICTSRDEILKAKGSKYLISHTNLVVSDIINENNTKKYAFVGLPCQIQAMRKLERTMPRLKDKITIYLGLICSNSFGNVNLDSQGLLLDALRVERQNIKEMRYRGDGWPGKFKVVLGNGYELSIKFDDYIRIIQFFMPVSCFVCNDSLSEFADISFGDAWLHNIKLTDNLGTSIIIPRTKRGDELIKKLKLQNILSIERTSEENIIKSQKGNLYRKKSFLNYRLAMVQALGYCRPNWNITLPRMIIKGNKNINLFFKIQIISSFQYIHISMQEWKNVFTKNILKIIYHIFRIYLINKAEKSRGSSK